MSQEPRTLVCSACLRASCWHGHFMCGEAREAGLLRATAEQLRRLAVEHESWWVGPMADGHDDRREPELTESRILEALQP